MIKRTALHLIGLAGGIFIIASIFLSFNIFLHYTFVLCLGWWFLFDFLHFLFTKKSIIISKRTSPLLLILLAGGIIGLIFEIYAQFFSPVWTDPFFYSIPDFLLSIVAWILFLPAGYETFAFFNDILIKKEREVKNKSFSRLIKYLFWVSLIFIIIPLLDFLIFKHDFGYSGIYFPFFNIGFWFLLDIFNYKKGQFCLLHELVSNVKIFIPLILSSLLFGFFVELLNITQYVWKYFGLPFIEYEVLGIPYVALIGWIPLMAVWVSGFYVVKSVLKK